MREFRLKDSMLEQGRREGRAEAAAEFTRRLMEMERKLAVLWDAFCREPTQRIERPEDGHG